MKWLFRNNNLDDTSFVDAGYDSEPTLNEITDGSYIFNDLTLKPLSYLYDDLKHYLLNHDLSDSQKSQLSAICDRSPEIKEISNIVEVLSRSYPDTAKEIIQNNIDKAHKKSEKIILSNKIKNIFGDEEWAHSVKNS